LPSQSHQSWRGFNFRYITWSHVQLPSLWTHFWFLVVHSSLRDSWAIWVVSKVARISYSSPTNRTLTTLLCGSAVWSEHSTWKFDVSEHLTQRKSTLRTLSHQWEANKQLKECNVGDKSRRLKTRERSLRKYAVWIAMCWDLRHMNDPA